MYAYLLARDMWNEWFLEHFIVHIGMRRWWPSPCDTEVNREEKRIKKIEINFIGYSFLNDKNVVF